MFLKFKNIKMRHFVLGFLHFEGVADWKGQALFPIITVTVRNEIDKVYIF